MCFKWVWSTSSSTQALQTITPETLHPEESCLSPHSSICKQTHPKHRWKQGTEMCPDGQGEFTLSGGGHSQGWSRGSSSVFNNNHKNGSSSAQDSKFFEVNRARETENLSSTEPELSFMSWKLVPSMSGLDRINGISTKNLTPTQALVPARIVPWAGPTAEVIKVKPAASQLLISVLLQTSEEKLKPGRKLLSQPTIYEVPSHSRVCSATSSPSQYSL